MFEIFIKTALLPCGSVCFVCLWWALCGGTSCTARASTQRASQTHKTYAATWQQCSFYKYFKHFKNWITATQQGNKWGNPWWWS